jgi:hypothetical protein
LVRYFAANEGGDDAPPITPTELSKLANSLQEQGILNLDVPAKKFLQLQGLTQIEGSLTGEEGVQPFWYIIGGSGYAVVCK